MGEFKVGDRAKVSDRPGWPDGYKIAGWEGEIVEVKEDPKDYVIMLADKTGYRMAFPVAELEKIWTVPFWLNTVVNIELRQNILGRLQQKWLTR